VTASDRPAAIRCLIADDQAMVRESFAAILAAQPVGARSPHSL
jgi:hypothetical protein